ncbi:unnamed protein product [Ophioblennius macclurei]
MKLLRGAACTLLVCCSALWVVTCTKDVAPPPAGDTRLAFSSDASSTSGGSENIHRRSVSPWIWRSSYTRDRIPATLWEAQCSNSCSSPDPAQNPRLDLVSVLIYQNILVLTRRGGARCYTASYRSVAVGCTCAWAKTDQK